MRKRVSQDNLKAGSNIETVRQFASSPGNSSELQALLIQIEKKNQEQRAILRRVCNDTGRLIEREQQLEENYSTALQKRDEFETRIRELEESKLAANFGTDFSMPVQKDDLSQHSPANGVDRGSPVDECPMRLNKIVRQQEDDQQSAQDNSLSNKSAEMKMNEERIFYPKGSREEDHEPDMFAADSTATQNRDPLEAIFDATHSLDPKVTAPLDDDFFSDKKPAQMPAIDDEDDIFKEPVQKAKVSEGQKLQDLVAHDSDEEVQAKTKKKDDDDDDFFN